MVSKSVHKHGDHAFSIFGHTRHYLPIGSGIKINQFFPSKNYHYQESITSHENHEDKPVNEQQAEPNNEELINLYNERVETTVKTIAEEGEHIPEATEAPVSNTEPVEGPVEVHHTSAVPLPVAYHNENINNDAENIHKMPVVEKTAAYPSKIVNNEKIHKEDHHPDSELASSYYHSKTYYVGF